jgi:cation diffusion facilitator CzcD-associated flavoprotein CzcO
LSTSHHRIAIVGSGFAGIGMAIALRKAGMEDFVVLERAGDVGGTWRDNTYPGCQCDVPSALYSFSFAPNPNWTHTYPLQPELGAYMRDTAQRHGILGHVRFHTPMRNARWDVLAPVLHHNAMDLVTTAELWARIGGAAG